jgi:hypothetical protein
MGPTPERTTAQTVSNAVCDPDTDDAVPAELAADAREAEPREAARISAQDHLRVRDATQGGTTAAPGHRRR